MNNEQSMETSPQQKEALGGRWSPALRKETLLRLLLVVVLCISSGSCAGKNFSRTHFANNVKSWEQTPACFYSLKISEEAEFEDGMTRNYYWAEIDYVYRKDDALFRSQQVYPEPFFTDDFQVIERQLGSFSALENKVLVNPENHLQSLVIPQYQDRPGSMWPSGLWTLVVLVSCFFLLGLNPQLGGPLVLGLTLAGFWFSYQGPVETSDVQLSAGGQAAFEKLLRERSEELSKDSLEWQQAKGRTISELRKHFGREKHKFSGNGVDKYHFTRKYWPKAQIAYVKQANGKVSETTEFFKN